MLLPTLPWLGFSLYSAYRYADERRDAIEAELARRADSLANELRDRIGRTYGYVHSLAISNAARTRNLPVLYGFAQRVQAASPEIAAVSLISADERMLFLTLRPLGAELPASRLEAVREVFSTGLPAISGPFKAPISDRIVVALGVPVTIDGRVAYCLRAIIGTDTISDALKVSGLPDGWVATVLDREGIVVGRSQAHGRHVGQRGTTDLLKAIERAERQAWDYVGGDGIANRGALRPIDPWGWHVAVGAPADTLIAPLRDEMRRLTLFACALAALSLAAVLWVSRRIARGMRETAEASRAVLLGTPAPTRETGIAELDEMRAGLTEVDAYNRLLEHRVAERTTALAAARARAEQFASELERHVEAERRRIAREVHDQIGSALTGVKLMLRGMAPAAPQDARQRQVFDAIDAAVRTARRISGELRPPLIDELGLQAALESLLETAFRDQHIAFTVRLDAPEGLSERQTIGCYRIVQEACTNVVRHAQATRVEITGAPAQRGGYRIVIRDDGVGMPPPGARRAGLGLTGMQERAELMGGSLARETPADGGLLLALWLPQEAPLAQAPEDPARAGRTPDGA